MVTKLLDATQQTNNLKQRRINVNATSRRRIDVDTTLFWRMCLLGNVVFLFKNFIQKFFFLFESKEFYLIVTKWFMLHK